MNRRFEFGRVLFVLAFFGGIAGISLVAQGAQADAAPTKLQQPVDVCAGPDGAVYIADPNLPGIWRLQDGKLEIFFQASKQFRTPLNRVRCLAMDSEGTLYAGDSATREVYRFDGEGKPQPLSEGKIGIPMGLAVNADGTVYASDLETHGIYKIPKGGSAERIADVAAPLGLALDDQQRLWIVTRGAHQLRRLAADGTLEVVVEGKPFEFPHDILLDDKGTAYVSDGYGKCVWKVVEGQPPEKWLTNEAFRNPVGLGAGSDTWYLSDSVADAIFSFDAGGAVKRVGE